MPVNGPFRKFLLLAVCPHRFPLTGAVWGLLPFGRFCLPYPHSTCARTPYYDTHFPALLSAEHLAPIFRRKDYVEFIIHVVCGKSFTSLPLNGLLANCHFPYVTFLKIDENGPERRHRKGQSCCLCIDQRLLLARRMVGNDQPFPRENRAFTRRVRYCPGAL